MIPQEVVLLSITWFMNILILGASIKFMLRLIRQKCRTYGSYMIFLLNIFCWIVPLINLLELVLPKTKTNAIIFIAIQSIAYEFSIFWAASLSTFAYKALRIGGVFSQKRFIIMSIVCCALATSVYPITLSLEVWGITVDYDTDKDGNKYTARVLYPLTNTKDQVIYFTLYEAMGRLVPAIVILFCYTRVYQVLRVAYKGIRGLSRSKKRKVLWFALLPLGCFVPEIIAETVCMSLQQERPFGVKILMCVSNRLWALLNLLVYWFFIPYKNKKTTLIEEAAADDKGMLESCSESNDVEQSEK